MTVDRHGSRNRTGRMSRFWGHSLLGVVAMFMGGWL